MFCRFFFSPQVKRSLIISNELPYTSCRTTEDLVSYEIRKVQKNVKTSWNYNLVPSLPPLRFFFLSMLAKDSLKIEIELSRSALFHMKTRIFLKYFVRACSYVLVCQRSYLGRFMQRSMVSFITVRYSVDQ